jgi:DNA polymerase-1
MKQPAFVLDAYGLIYRSYFAFISKPLTNREGNNVSAVFGFFRTLHGLFERYDPKVFIAAFDSRSPTFRHEMYAEYKATRQKTPEDLHAQVPIIEEILTALGIAVVRQDGFEADDIIASVASRCAAEGRECRIISGDKDLMQLVGGGTTILKVGKTGGWDDVNAEGVREEWGVGPELMLDLLSLTGDASDNVPGIKGVGDKTALKLLEAWGSLDGIFEHAGEITGAIGVKIRKVRKRRIFRGALSRSTRGTLGAELDSYACLCLDRIAGARLFLREAYRASPSSMPRRTGHQGGGLTRE